MPTTTQKRRAASSSSGGGRSGSTELSRGSAGSLRVASVSLAAVLVLAAVSTTRGAPVEPWQTTADKRHLLSQIDTACSSFFSMDVHFQASDVLGEICFLMLVQKSKSAAWQPFLHLVSHLHTRRERGISVQAELEGPGGIQSRGYFLYRPRNGRRALEYE
ncbi:neuromedin-U [Syngnathoides biaculeatus]|uniref:neuromedin-U n=1 Tax=Syngnathoides biaculeatus TaxID=300417 RepID=UPI002ADDFADA|nr:neuromedin-U [Syngnathoides biaculeatus]